MLFRTMVENSYNVRTNSIVRVRIVNKITVLILVAVFCVGISGSITQSVHASEPEVCADGKPCDSDEDLEDSCSDDEVI